jgi:DNA-binding GntR family transcriptional regulator
LTRTQYVELIDLRLLLEGAATERASHHMTPARIKALRKIAAELSAAAEQNHAPRYLKANRTFKFTIFEAANSPAMIDLIERVWLQIGPFLRYYAKDVRDQIDTDEHHAIVEALANGDGPAARAAMKRDINGGKKYLLETAEFAPEEPIKR